MFKLFICVFCMIQTWVASSNIVILPHYANNHNKDFTFSKIPFKKHYSTKINKNQLRFVMWYFSQLFPKQKVEEVTKCVCASFPSTYIPFIIYYNSSISGLLNTSACSSSLWKCTNCQTFTWPEVWTQRQSTSMFSSSSNLFFIISLIYILFASYTILCLFFLTQFTRNITVFRLTVFHIKICKTCKT